MIIIDDHSRMIVGGGMFYHDNACNFQNVLKEAVSTYGIPAKLYCDHGSPYDNEQLPLICGQIGTTMRLSGMGQRKQSVRGISGP